MHSYEIEIKSLLGSSDNAEKLRAGMKEIDPKTELHSHHKELNHYFYKGDVNKLAKLAQPKLSKEEQERLKAIIQKGKDFSVRTRQADGKVLLVLKASVDEGTSSNTVSRLEFEAPVKMSLDELDQLLLDAGFAYQAKWSREREEYICKDTNVCIDKNAGYGYLAEFEKVVSDEAHIADTKRELYELMDLLGVEELPQERLERMFSYYNEHWPEYYGTDNVFVIE